MGGVDIVVFTGGIGENSSMVRQFAMEGLEFLGFHLDKKLNKNNYLSFGKRMFCGGDKAW